MKTLLAHWKRDFFGGLAWVLPAAASIGILVWLFAAVAAFTDTLLLFLPKAWTHALNGEGPTHLYWTMSLGSVSPVYPPCEGSCGRPSTAKPQDRISSNREAGDGLLFGPEPDVSGIQLTQMPLHLSTEPSP